MGVERRWNPPPAAVPPSSVGMKRARPPGHLRASEGARPTSCICDCEPAKVRQRRTPDGHRGQLAGVCEPSARIRSLFSISSIKSRCGTIFSISISTVKEPIGGTIFSVVRRPPTSCLVPPSSYRGRIIAVRFTAHRSTHTSPLNHPGSSTLPSLCTPLSSWRTIPNLHI
ncbi:hypothetical protein C2845_PM14G12020 [Panicum miliaceum]|uniref:Uncharacterized protein n=1 Tax=Panicum miliaceum TaxID=4540 RepID=A0A3L6PMT5_PANMI|nr:hypothetical protein C2845_PM14G12020 [Panicum miliaceum]